MKNFSKAAENNSQPILSRLESLFLKPGTVLEIGSGSGQHAIHFADRLPQLTWQPSEQSEKLATLAENLDQFAPGNVLSPVSLDIGQDWPDIGYDHVFAANVVHIMSANLIPSLFAGASSGLTRGGFCCLYGPYRYGGEFTSESNARFDVWLKQTYTHAGIRDIEVVVEEAKKCHLSLVHDYAMPANNQLLVFRLD